MTKAIAANRSATTAAITAPPSTTAMTPIATSTPPSRWVDRSARGTPRPESITRVGAGSTSLATPPATSTMATAANRASPTSTQRV